MIPQNLSEANDLILSEIAASHELTILGFLPLSAAQEDAVLKWVRAALQGDVVNVSVLLIVAPAAIAYSLAAAPSRALKTGGEFWPALVRELGVDVPGPERRRLILDFIFECRRLGLLTGTLEGAGWHLAAPIIFQSGILHYWKDDLASGLRATLRNRPAPDLHDPEALSEFAAELRDSIHQQATLRRMLDTAVGPLLVSRLVRGYLKDDWSRLPAHLREPIRDAFSASGRGVVLRSPYLAFDEAFGQLTLVLPALAKGLASAETYWKIDARRHAARKETEIPLEELAGGELRIGLHRLEGGFADRKFVVDARIDEGCPFRVFRPEGGRELRGYAGKSAELPAGGYFVVTAADVTSGEDEEPLHAGDLRYYDLELRPGDDPLVLRREGAEWTLAAKREQGIFIDRERGSSVPLKDGVLLHYGPDMGLIAYFPADPGVEGFRLSLHCAEQNLKYECAITAPAGNPGGYVFASELELPLAAGLDQLPPGIHRLEIKVSDATRQARRVLWFWRGLDRISESMGFRCSALPTNVDFPNCRGVVVGPSGLTFRPNYHAPEIVLRLNQPSETLVLPRAGVRVTLTEQGAAWEEEPGPHVPVTVGGNDKRLLRFVSGGFHTWTITGGGREIVVLDRSRTVRVMSLAGVATEIGGSGRIIATSDDGSVIPLLNLTRPLSASAPKLKADHGRGLELWTFRVPTAELEAIGVAVTDLSDRSDAETGEIRSVAHRTDDGFECVELDPGGVPATVSVSRAEQSESNASPKLRVQLAIRDSELGDGLWAIDFFRRANGESDWLPLDCAETHGYSKLRIFAWGPGVPLEGAGWWRHLRRAGRPSEGAEAEPMLAAALTAMSAEELDCALASCRRFLEWKYPTAVWNAHAHRVQDFPVHIGRHRFSAGEDTAEIWWRHASEEISAHSRAFLAPVARQVLFGSRPDCLRLARQHLRPTETEECLVRRSLNVPAAIGAAGSLKDYLLPAVDAGEVDDQLLFCYSNFQAVYAGQAADFSDFSLISCLRGCLGGGAGLERRAEELYATSPRLETARLLGPEHLLHAVQAVNRRCRVIEESSMQEVETPLSRMGQTLERVAQQLDMVAPAIAERTGWMKSGDSVWTPPLMENPASAKVAKILWVLCGLSRLAAHQRISDGEHRQLLNRLLAPGSEGERMIQNRICVLLSLGPELFAFYTALFEITFSTVPTPNYACTQRPR